MTRKEKNRLLDKIEAYMDIYENLESYGETYEGIARDFYNLLVFIENFWGSLTRGIL